MWLSARRANHRCERKDLEPTLIRGRLRMKIRHRRRSDELTEAASTGLLQSTKDGSRSTRPNHRPGTTEVAVDCCITKASGGGQRVDISLVNI
jgi:hypothetical protein